MSAIRWAVVILLATGVAVAHPHDEAEIFTFKGTLTRIDAVKRAIELDTIDPWSKKPRNLLLFVEAKAKLRDGKARVALSSLQPGQRVIVVAEVQHTQAGADRLLAFDITTDRSVR